MLILDIFGIGNAIKTGILGLFLCIDGIVYWVVSILFNFFMDLAGARIFMESVYEKITNNFLVIIGVVMLFYLAYALLKSLVNPDEATKNTSKIVTNLVISLVLLSIVPTIFNNAYKLQYLVINENVIGKIIFGNSNNSLSNSSKDIALQFFDAFITDKDDVEVESYANWSTLKKCILKSEKNDDSYDSDCSGDESFLSFFKLSGPVADGKISYIFLITTLCGGFLVYIIASFCLDLGIRVVKLTFYQIISPVPIMMRIIPEKKSVFDNWVKGVLSTYFEVFIRIFIIYLVVFLASAIFSLNGISTLSGEINIFGQIIIVMGLFAFAKQAPKLISDMTGIDSGNIKLGIRDKLATGGALTAGAFLGAGATGLVRNFTNGTSQMSSDIKNAKGFGNKFKAMGKGVLNTSRSAFAGGISGAVRGGKAGWSAKNFTDVKNAASKGATGATEKRDKRANYKALHGGTFRGAMVGHAQDFGGNIANWATGGSAEILSKVNFEQEFKDSYKDYEAIYENPNYDAMKTQLQKFKALKASSTNAAEITDYTNKIKKLEGNMLKARMESIQKNTQSSAYAIYNIAQLAKSNPQLAGDIGIDVSMADDLQLKGNKIIDKSTGNEIEADKLYEIIEGTSLSGVTYDATTGEFMRGGSQVDFTTVADSQTKDGISHQKKIASDQLKRDTMSVEYKEAQKKKDAQNKK